MKTDLLRLRLAEEGFFAESSRYAPDLGRAFGSTPGVSKPVVVLTAKGYIATVTHERLPGAMCGIGVGTPNPIGRALDGEVACRGSDK